MTIFQNIESEQWTDKTYLKRSFTSKLKNLENFNVIYFKTFLHRRSNHKCIILNVQYIGSNLQFILKQNISKELKSKVLFSK